jgi:hypothetical protein
VQAEHARYKLRKQAGLQADPSRWVAPPQQKNPARLEPDGAGTSFNRNGSGPPMREGSERPAYQWRALDNPHPSAAVPLTKLPPPLCPIPISELT